MFELYIDHFIRIPICYGGSWVPLTQTRYHFSDWARNIAANKSRYKIENGRRLNNSNSKNSLSLCVGMFLGNLSMLAARGRLRS